MSLVTLRKYLDMEPGGAPQAGAGAGASHPECEQACQAWAEQFERLFPALPEEQDPPAPRCLLGPPGEWRTAEERVQALRALLELAGVRRAAERASLRRQADEVRNLVATFNEAVLTLASGGEEVAGRFQRVEASLVRAARMDDLASVRGCLRDTMEMLRRESQAHEAETATRVAAFEAELARARSFAQPLEGGGSLDRQQACLLIRSELSSAAAAEFVATVIVFDRLTAARARFGQGLTSEALGAYARARAADSAAGGRVYRWSEQSLFWKAKPGFEPAALRAATESLLGKPFDYRTVAGGRPAVISLSGRWFCAFPGEGGAEALIEEIDQFAGGGRWTGWRETARRTTPEDVSRP